MGKHVIIVGGGIAGLSSGITLAKNGFEVDIYEKNAYVGGLCSGYYVRGHYVDACFHWLMGTAKGTTLNEAWKELGGLPEDIEISHCPTLGEFIYEGASVFLDRDLKKAESSWIALSPLDEKAIKKFFACVKELVSATDLSQSSTKIKTAKNEMLPLLENLPHSLHLIKAMNQSREEYASKFVHPAIRFALTHGQTGYNNALFFMVQYAFFVRGDADVPMGGALELVKRLEERFLSLGGHIHYQNEVQQVLFQDDVAIGIQTNEHFFYGDYILLALDPTYAETHLAKRRLLPKIHKLKESVNSRDISSCFSVYLALEGDVSSLTVPTCIHIKPIKIGSRESDALLIRPYSFDPSFTSNGKTMVSLFIDQNQDDYLAWDEYVAKAYKKEFERVKQEMIHAFLEFYPRFAGKLEFIDAFGPLELEKATHTSFGAIQAYSLTSVGTLYQLPVKARGIEHLYLASQWNRCIGGTPTALAFGLLAAKAIIKKEQPSFVSKTIDSLSLLIQK